MLHSWIKKNHIGKLAIHLDVDVLMAEDFRSILYNKPGISHVYYATGKMTLTNVLDA